MSSKNSSSSSEKDDEDIDVKKIVGSPLNNAKSV